MLARRRLQSDPRRRLVGRLEHERRRGAEAEPARDEEVAFHQLDKTARQHQADAGAFDVRFLGAEPVERLEEALQLLGRHAEAAVLDADRPALAVALPADRDRAADPVVLHCVAEEIHEHLTQAQLVRQHPDRVPRRDAAAGVEVDDAGARIGDAKANIGLGRERRDHAERIGDRVLQIDGFERDHHLARLDPRQVEDVVDEREQVRAGVLDVLDAAELLDRRRSARVEAKQLRETEHGVERRAQLVAHPRQEFGLCAARRFERRARMPLGTREVQLGDVAQHDRHQHAAIGVELGERCLEREFLAIGALADQLVQRPRRPGGVRADRGGTG